MDAYYFWKNFDSQLYKKQYTMVEFAKRNGLSYSSLTQLRTKNRMPKLDLAVKIARGLNTSVEYLVTGTTEDNELCPEAMAVNSDKDLQCLVRLCIEDRQLFSVIKRLIQAPKVGNVSGEDFE